MKNTITILKCKICGKEIKIQHINPLVKEAWICCEEEMEIKKEE